ncbi:MAG: hypothetical protein ACR2PO_04825 [Methyloligellaceae bacterium]
MKLLLLALLVASAATMASPGALKSDGVRAVTIAWSGARTPRQGMTLYPVRPVQYHCRADCRYCRDVCYGRWRVRCYGPHCRGQFTLCMRACWDRICRWC